MDEDAVEIKLFQFTVGRSSATARLDSYLSARFADYSRTFIKRLIEEGRITVNGRSVKPSYGPQSGDSILALVPMMVGEGVEPEDIALDVIYEDRWLIAVNKPADMVVHPARGHYSGTLVNAVSHHCRDLSPGSGPLRPGVVHRLDRDTSGVILLIKDASVHEAVSCQFAQRTVRKQYVAICEGRFELDGDVVNAPVGPHHRVKEKMAVRHDVGKEASTRYEVVERLGDFSIVRCFPESGRTHQIRIHLCHVRHPVVCDRLYGRRDAIYLSDLTGGEHYPSEEPLLARQALHARRITIQHPGLRRPMTFEAPMPADMMALVEALRRCDSGG